MAITTTAFDYSKSSLASHTQRGSFGIARVDLAYTADATASSFVVDTIDIGAGSVAFHINNGGSQSLTLRIYGSIDNTSGTEVEIPFKSEAGVETTTGGKTVASSGTCFAIVSYASYPEAASLRFFKAKVTPGSATTGTITIQAVVK